ncbi:MAG TPA: hypothetical protein VFQ51_15880 [Vicinamibacteria bacterium]|nr:hypothetical protein [Vicinamibacteria bacterium]
MAPPAARAAASPRRRAPVALALLAVGVAMGFLSLMWGATGGRFVPQVVDLYLVCQYAKAMADGHPFQYYAGDPATTGATSLLHTAVLAAAHKVGLRGEGLVAFAILTGAALLVVSTDLARRAGTRLGGERTGWLAGALVALGGPVVWGFMYGADVALFMTLALWLLLELVSGWPSERVGHVAGAGVLIALTRPEGLLVGLALGIASLLAPGRRRDARARLLAWAPLVAACAVLAVNRVATGSWIGTSIADKSLVATYGVPQALALVSDFLVDVIRGLLLGFYPSQAPIGFSRGWAPLFFPPLGLLLVLLALVRAGSSAWGLRLWAGVAAVVTLLVAPNMFMGTHFNRYLLWSFPGLLVLVAVGLNALSTMLARGDARLDRRVFLAGAMLFVTLGFLSTVRFGVVYGDLAGQVARRDLAVAEWIKRELPRGAVVANLATSVEYLTGHRSLNLHGVTTAQFLGNRPAEREAGVLEALGRIPPAERPGLLMATESALQGASVLRELTAEPPLFRTSSFTPDEIVVLRMQYGPLSGSDEPRLPETLKAVAGRERVDRLNVCDTRDEDAHAYDVEPFAGGLPLAGTARVDEYPDAAGGRVADAGRAVRGRETFTITTRPGRDLLIVSRTAPSVRAVVWAASGATAHDLDFPDEVFALRVNGQPVGTTTFRPRRGWDEIVLKVEAARIVAPRTTLELRGRYTAFRYWFYQ